jgi:hypothetical protein
MTSASQAYMGTSRGGRASTASCIRSTATGCMSCWILIVCQADSSLSLRRICKMVASLGSLGAAVEGLGCLRVEGSPRTSAATRVWLCRAASCPVDAA